MPPKPTSLMPSPTMAKKHVHLVRITLEEIGHSQPATPAMATDNNTASGIDTDSTVKQNRSKEAVDMRFDWIRPGQFQIYWLEQRAKAKQTAPTIFLNTIRPPHITRRFVLQYVFVVSCKSCEELF